MVYASKVDHGFDKASAADLQERLKPLIRKTQPYAKRIAHKGIWVEPKLLAEIEYRAKSAEGKLRHLRDADPALPSETIGVDGLLHRRLSLLLRIEIAAHAEDTVPAVRKR